MTLESYKQYNEESQIAGFDSARFCRDFEQNFLNNNFVLDEFPSLCDLAGIPNSVTEMRANEKLSHVCHFVPQGRSSEPRMALGILVSVGEDVTEKISVRLLHLAQRTGTGG